MELGFMEMVVIAILIIVLFGPDKLPQIARDLGSGMRKMRGAVEDIKTEILKETDAPVSEIKKEIEKVKAAANNYQPIIDIKQELKEIKEITTQSATTTPEVPPKVDIHPSENQEHEGPVNR